MNAYSLPSRWVLFIGALLAFLVIGAAIAAACTIYYGTNTIENISTGSGEYTVVADNFDGQAMDRCDGAGSGSHFSASNDNQDTVRVEIDGENNKDGCEVGSMAGKGDVYVNTYDGDAYHDDTSGHSLSVDGNHDGDGVYEDYDLGDSGNENNGEASHERHGDCMGDGDSGDLDPYPDEDGAVISKYAGPDDDGDGHGDGIAVNSSGQFASGETNNGSDDADGDGVNDVDITIDTASDSSTDHASGVCVSDANGGDSAPQIPLVIS